MALQQRLSTRSRLAFSGARVGHAVAARPVAINRSRGVSVNAMVREWPDKEFIAETLSIFPDEGVANAEQARVGDSRANAGCHRLWQHTMLSCSSSNGPGVAAVIMHH
jgi:hypothetical protein